MKALVIPDVHLKPWMFDEAEKINREKYDVIVFLGDLVDDWGQEFHEALYRETIGRAADFAKNHNGYLFWCFGNHDISYDWGKYESGYSSWMRSIVRDGNDSIRNIIPKEMSGFVVHIENTVFSHAGVSKQFVEENHLSELNLEALLRKINLMGPERMWGDNSPIWARPGWVKYEGALGEKIWQVVGHTPVDSPRDRAGILMLDTFSTYSDGTPIGDAKFVIVDTDKCTWKYAEE